MLTLYNNPKAKISSGLTQGLYFDDDFIPLVDNAIDIAEKHGVTFLFTSGFRMNSDNLSGAVVTPAKMSNHFVGQAWDCSFFVDGKFYNSTFLKEKGIPDLLKASIEEIKGIGLRWGGDFTKVDLVHFDSGLNLSNPELYRQKYNEYHQALQA